MPCQSFSLPPWRRITWVATPKAVGSRALTGSVTYDFVAMTPELCEEYCTVNNTFAYYGIEYTGECYCGDALNAGAIKTFESQCTIPCPAPSTEICGGNGHLSLYGVSADPPVETDVAHPEVTAPVYLGCYHRGHRRSRPGGAMPSWITPS